MTQRNLKLRKSLSERFHEKIIPITESGCWLWIGATKELGYGVIGLGRRTQGTSKAHRVSWELYNGNIPKGMNVLHKCDIPSCVNPKHLFIGTLSDNMKDCVNKKRNFVPNNSKENAKWAKLNNQSVEHIRKKEMSGVDYAKLYNVSKSAIYNIWSGLSWK